MCAETDWALRLDRPIQSARPLRSNRQLQSDRPPALLRPLQSDRPPVLLRPLRPADVFQTDTLSLDAQRSGTRLGSTSPSAGAALRSAGRHRQAELILFSQRFTRVYNGLHVFPKDRQDRHGNGLFVSVVDKRSRGVKCECGRKRGPAKDGQDLR